MRPYFYSVLGIYYSSRLPILIICVKGFSSLVGINKILYSKLLVYNLSFFITYLIYRSKCSRLQSTRLPIRLRPINPIPTLI
jgi:hypothetical protein